MNVLTLNVGSSSLKFGIYRVEGLTPTIVVEGEIESGGGGGSVETLQKIGGSTPIDAVAHRVVHGGPWLREHCQIDEAVMLKIEAAASFAPLHVPAAIAWIRHAGEAFPQSRQVACFDTAFHHGLPDTARVLPLPHEWLAKGVEKYGFHGLSCESILAQMESIPDRLIIAHLGNGASLTAVKAGKSIDTSMGMTPTGGIIMGTRPGDLDPGVLLFLLHEGHVNPQELEILLERHSGLRGISDLSSDVRELALAADQPLAVLALEQFARSAAKQAAAMAISLGGVDLLVFTGGIGEHAANTRYRIEQLLAPCFPELKSKTMPSLENRTMAMHAARLTMIHSLEKTRSGSLDSV